MPENLPDRMSNRMSEDIPEDMPNRMPDRIECQKIYHIDWQKICQKICRIENEKKDLPNKRKKHRDKECQKINYLEHRD